MTLRDRFEMKYIPVTESGCWLWTASTDQHGYGRIGVDRKNRQAHRVAWELYKGRIPSNTNAATRADIHTIDHLCRVRSCVNPDHLEVVTLAENVKRSPKELHMWRLRITHCPSGHPYSGDNLYTVSRSTGQRSRACKQCVKARNRTQYLARKGRAL